MVSRRRPDGSNRKEVTRGWDASAHPGIDRQDRMTLAAGRCLLPAVLGARLAARCRVHRDAARTRDAASRSLMRCSSTSAPTPARRRRQPTNGVVQDLHAAGAVGTYDAGVVTKDAAGKVHVSKDEMATRHGTWGGGAGDHPPGGWSPHDSFFTIPWVSSSVRVAQRRLVTICSAQSKEQDMARESESSSPDRTVLPPAGPSFRGEIEVAFKDSRADFPAAGAGAGGRAECAADHG